LTLLFSEDEKEVLEDLMKAALNQAKEKVEEMSAEEMKKITGGLAFTPRYENAILICHKTNFKN
jgi:bacteriocin-like protein